MLTELLADFKEATTGKGMSKPSGYLKKLSSHPLKCKILIVHLSTAILKIADGDANAMCARRRGNPQIYLEAAQKVL